MGQEQKGVNAPETSNTYRYYHIKTDSDDVASAEITFTVNQTFVDQYDEVVLARYDNGWNNQPTNQLRQEDSKVVYRAKTTGFSYFAVKGQNSQQNTGNESTNQTTSPDSQNETTEGDQTKEEPLNTTEPGKTDSTSEQQKQTEENNNLPVMLIVGVVLLLVALGGGGFYGYRFYEKKQLETRAEELQHRIHSELEDHEIENSDQVYQELDKAEKALNEKNYGQLEKCLDRVDDLL